VPVVTASPHAVPPQSAAARTAAPATVAVSGEAVVRRTPELMRLVLSVEAVRERAAEAMAAAGMLADRLVGAACSAGIAAEDIRTVDVSLLPAHAADASGARVTGYRAGECFQLTVRHLGYAGPTLELIAGACCGESRIESVAFGVADPAALRSAAREQAFAEAEARAVHYALLAGRELGPLLALDEQDEAAAAALLPLAANAQALLAAGQGADPAMLEERAGVRAVFALR
jgi:uncharacterized protein YggE